MVGRAVHESHMLKNLRAYYSKILAKLFKLTEEELKELELGVKSIE
jgi:hypothetical protein